MRFYQFSMRNYAFTRLICSSEHGMKIIAESECPHIHHKSTHPSLPTTLSVAKALSSFRVVLAIHSYIPACLNWAITIYSPWFATEFSYKINWAITIYSSCVTTEFSYKINWAITINSPWVATEFSYKIYWAITIYSPWVATEFSYNIKWAITIYSPCVATEFSYKINLCTYLSGIYILAELAHFSGCQYKYISDIIISSYYLTHAY